MDILSQVLQGLIALWRVDWIIFISLAITVLAAITMLCWPARRVEASPYEKRLLALREHPDTLYSREGFESILEEHRREAIHLLDNFEQETLLLKYCEEIDLEDGDGMSHFGQSF